jgi:serine phosphatase RsbU (regulator of sigma subunit)
MEIGAELIWSLLPPATFATTGFVVSGMLEPCYRAGGDAFDYAVNERTAHLAILDAMGHGAAACEAAAFTLSAYRSARRAGLDLIDTYRSVDDAMSAFYDGDRYATAVFAELDLATGRLSWLNAGHPEPLVIRGGRQVKTLRRVPLTPLGVPFTAGPIEAGIEQLEPGDGVLLYTDGLPEARQPDGSFFGLGRLVDFVERAGQAGYPAPETLRRLRDSVLRHQHGELQDDASALLMEWRRGTEQAMVPGNVLPAATDDEPAVRPTRS